MKNSTKQVNVFLGRSPANGLSISLCLLVKSREAVFHRSSNTASNYRKNLITMCRRGLDSFTVSLDSDRRVGGLPQNLDLNHQSRHEALRHTISIQRPSWKQLIGLRPLFAVVGGTVPGHGPECTKFLCLKEQCSLIPRYLLDSCSPPCYMDANKDNWRDHLLRSHRTGSLNR